jgi:asparagine synthase (glutamine-hydrolysing)
MPQSRSESSLDRRIKAFSAVFPGDPIDETEYILAVYRAVNAEHNPVELTAEDLWRDLPTLVKCQEEPFGSASVYAQWCVLKRANEQGIRVMLDGQGGDELLCGDISYYFYYLLTLIKRRKYSRFLTEFVRSSDLTMPFAKRHLKDFVANRRHAMSSFSQRLALLVKSTSSPRTLAEADAHSSELATELTMNILANSLPASIRYVDKNSRYYGIEMRFPFLYRPFFEYVSSLPLNRKIRNGWTKHDFRIAMKDVLPETIRLRRNKLGFQAPQKKWIQEELGWRLRRLLLGSDLTGKDYYDLVSVQCLLDRPRLTDYEASYVWRVLNIELWFREFFPRKFPSNLLC